MRKGGTQIPLDGRAGQVAEALGIRMRPGYDGAFSDAQCPDAKFINGARVRKTVKEYGDRHPVGALGTVLGSVGPVPDLGVGYFVSWDADPRKPTLVIESKLGPAP